LEQLRIKYLKAINRDPSIGSGEKKRGGGPIRKKGELSVKAPKGALKAKK